MKKVLILLLIICGWGWSVGEVRADNGTCGAETRWWVATGDPCKLIDKENKCVNGSTPVLTFSRTKANISKGQAPVTTCYCNCSQTGQSATGGKNYINGGNVSGQPGGAAVVNYTGSNLLSTLPKDPLAFANLGGIIGGPRGLLAYIYVFAGLSLLVMLILGGVTLMTAGGNPDKVKAGYGKIVGGLIGFLIIFISYFVVQIVEVMLGIKIL